MTQGIEMSEASSYWMSSSLCQPDHELDNFLRECAEMFWFTYLVFFSLSACFTSLIVY